MSRRRRVNADALLRRAVDAVNGGDFTAGFDLAEKVLAAGDNDDAMRVATHAAMHMSPEGAAQAFERLAALRPNDGGILNDWGGVLCQLSRYDDAVGAFRRALAVRPDDAATLANLAVALCQLDRLDEAEDAARRGIVASPDNAAAHNGLGTVLERRGQLEEALAAYRRACQLAPTQRAFQDNLLLALTAIGSGFDETERILRSRLANRPDDVDSLIRLAGALRDQCKFAKAHETLDRLMALSLSESQRAQALAALSEVQFLAGDFAAAWANYRWREKWVGFKRRPHRQPEWTGEDLAGRSILVWSEQGVGDEIMFTRFLPLLAATGAKVVLETDPRLVALFRRSFPGVTVVGVADPPDSATATGIDFQIPIGALGEKFWTRYISERPAARLQADKIRSAEMRARYLAAGNAAADQSTRLVGIAWRSVNVWMGGAKSITLDALAPLLRRRGTVFVDLQYGDNAADIEALAAATGSTIVHDQTFDQFQDLDAFAAQILALDAVVSISNTTVHMAGAQGVPTAVLLSSAPMWRWGTTGETSPWYDSIRLYRQHAPGDWRDPIAAATDFLDRAAAGAL
jgi:tetratricopeptide (TPR) repeat protein